MSQSSAISKLDGVALGGTCQLADGQIKTVNDKVISFPMLPQSKPITVPNTVIYNLSRFTGSQYFAFSSGDLLFIQADISKWWVISSIDITIKGDITATELEDMDKNVIMRYFPKPVVGSGHGFASCWGVIVYTYDRGLVPDLDARIQFIVDSNGYLRMQSTGTFIAEISENTHILGNFCYQTDSPYDYIANMPH